jgi:hypothetical protein
MQRPVPRRAVAAGAIPVLVAAALSACTGDRSPAVTSTTAPITTLPTSTPGSGDQIFMAVEGGTQAARKPRDAVLSADSSWFLKDVVWTEWTTFRAAGVGVEEINLCEPNCATGKHQLTQVEIYLFDPVPLCGRFFYTTMSVVDDSGQTEAREAPEPQC